jgi:hypothetical protein
MKTVELMVRFNVTVHDLRHDQDVDSLYLDINTKKIRLCCNVGTKGSRVKGEVNEYETMEVIEV